MNWRAMELKTCGDKGDDLFNLNVLIIDTCYLDYIFLSISISASTNVLDMILTAYSKHSLDFIK